MALTPTEEALVRQLLDQQAAILSLAGNESTITSKLGATKVTLADLVAASSVADADLLLMRQGTNDKSVTPLLLKGYAQDGMATQKGVQAGDYNTSVAAGTADAITGDYTPNVLTLENGLTLFVRAAAANTTTTPTFSPDGLTAKTIVKGNNLALAAGDIAGAGHWLEMNFDTALDKWVLQNPAKGVGIPGLPSGSIIFVAQNAAPTGYLKANGALISRTTYAALFSAIGTTFGAGDGLTTFNIPDLRGEFLRAWDDARGIDSGRAFGTWQRGTLMGGDFDGVNAKTMGSVTTLNPASGTSHVGADPLINPEDYPNALLVAGGAGTNFTPTGTPYFFGVTRPRNIAMLACIKY